MDIQYETALLDQVINFFAHAYQIPSDKELVRYESWVDLKKGEVLFKLYLMKKERRSK